VGSLGRPIGEDIVERGLTRDLDVSQFGNVYESTSEMWQKELSKANPESQKVETQLY
jgi:hypothetical protein